MKFSPNGAESEEFSNTLTSKIEVDSNGSGNETTVEISSNTSYRKVLRMANNNLFATLKYVIEAVPFFDGQNIPLTYFIERRSKSYAA